jgi:hypothetical protein
MLRAWTAMAAGADVTNLRAWLYRIVHNTALNARSRCGYADSAIPEGSAALQLTEDLAEGRLTATAALAAVAALPPSQRTALTLTAIEGQSGRDAARAMGVSEPALRKLVSRARSGVRSAVSAVTPVPLATWAAGGGGTAAVGTAGVGAAGGLMATAAKIATVAAATAATVGGAHELQVRTDHPQPVARQVAGRSATGTAAEPNDAGGPAGRHQTTVEKHGAPGHPGQLGRDRSGAAHDGPDQTANVEPPSRPTAGSGSSGSSGPPATPAPSAPSGIHGSSSAPQQPADGKPDAQGADGAQGTATTPAGLPDINEAPAAEYTPLTTGLDGDNP